MKNFNIIIEKIYKPINEKIANIDLQIYKINNKKEFDNDILEILLEPKNNKDMIVDFDIILKANDIISNFIDEILSDVSEKYVLEVASAGLEKEVLNKEELSFNINKYFFVIYKKDGIKNEFNGTLTKIDDNYHFMYFLKGVKKNISLKWDEIEFIRYAIKF